MEAKEIAAEEVQSFLKNLKEEDCSEDFVEDMQEDLQEYNNSIFDMEN